jgi:L-amino acid N-acyltransferase YncA
MASRIRNVALTDAPAISRIYAPYVADHAISFELVPPDTAEMEKRIAGVITQYPWLVFEEDGDVLGYAYAAAHNPRHAYQWSVNVSVYLDVRAHRRGIGRALYTALFDLLRRQRFVNAYAGITLPNAASVGLHEAMGFVPVAVYPRVGFKFGKWYDTTWLHLRLAEEDGPPVGDPLPTAELWRDPSIERMLAAYAQTIRSV